MPLYEYKCDKCSHVFDKFLSVSARDTPLDEPCPNCKEEGAVRKLLNTPPVGDPVRMGLIKPPGGFRDVLNHIHNSTPGSVLNVDRNIG